MGNEKGKQFVQKKICVSNYLMAVVINSIISDFIFSPFKLGLGDYYCVLCRWMIEVVEAIPSLELS